MVIDMYINANIGKAKTAAVALATAAVCTSIIVFQQSCSRGALKGISLCLNVLVPSLFPFMAASTFIVKSGLAQKAGKPLSKITKVLFGLSGSFAPVIFLSMLGGYPVGAKGISQLYESKTACERECKRAAMFAVCAGPGFIISFVGASLYNSSAVGLIIFGSQIISVIFTGLILKLFAKSHEYSDTWEKTSFKPVSVSSAIVESAAEGAKGILSVCAFVVLFSAFTEIISQVISDNFAKGAVYCLLEVCTAVNFLSGESTLEMSAFAIGFGGLCVHFQIFSALGKLKINKALFFLIRIMQGIITALLVYLGTKLFPVSTQVFSTSAVESPEIYGGTVISAAALIGASICFLYSIKSIKQK